MIRSGCSQSSVAEDVVAAAHAACAQIAPAWPLDRSIAVNPYWPLRDRAFTDVADEMLRLAGSPMTMPMKYYKQRWIEGSISEQALRRALQDSGESFDLNHLIDALDEKTSPPQPIPLLSDVLDRSRNRERHTLWREHILSQVSQCCASYFDRYQADWPIDPEQSLYSYWRQMVTADIGAGLLMEDFRWRSRTRTLPMNPDELLTSAVTALAVEPERVSMLFRIALLRVHGWASWSAFGNWQASLRNQNPPPYLKELLAIRVAWEILLDDGDRTQGSSWSRWKLAWHRALLQPCDSSTVKAMVWLRAEEISYQEELFETINSVKPAPQSAIEAQAVFCIDVRSEPLRRHLEIVAPFLQTIGFAGFFGLPMDYRPLGSDTRIPQLPGLLRAAHVATETTGDPFVDARWQRVQARRLTAADLAMQYSRMPSAGFTLVEALGPWKAFSLLKMAFRLDSASHSVRQLEKDSRHGNGICLTLLATPSEKAELGERFLRATGLHQNAAPVVLLVGHRASTTNNPLASSLDCGACCGQSGFINARVLSQLLNDPEVRAGMRARGVTVPDGTRFVAAVHDTTLGVVTLDPRDRLRVDPFRLCAIEDSLRLASERVRQESEQRSPLSEDSLMRNAASQRARDWAETRPEWGLANNAAFIIGPRSLTRGVDLKGRCFLHEYDASNDVDGALLEQIMTAPMIVAHWINMQYFASTVDPERFGSGNKTLHNVVGGHIGVFEGNGGDLRIGLSRQSLHDGSMWRHAPIRLTVLVCAPRQMIEAVIDKHGVVRDLVQGRWLEVIEIDRDRQCRS